MSPVINSTQKLLLGLFFIPVALAHYYSLERSPISILCAFASVSLLIYASTAMLARFPAGAFRTGVGLFAIYLLSFYFSSLFISYYLQGSYFNQQYYFHSNLRNLIESAPAYLALFAMVIAWTLAVLIAYYCLRKRMTPSGLSMSALAILFILGLALDPGLRPAATSAVRAAMSPQIDSLDAIDFAGLNLNQDALTGSETTASAGKNLVLIFLEGLEQFYTDESLFPGLTPKLNALKAEGLVIENMQQVEGSGWTMAGLVSSLCGTPLLYESSFNGNEVLFSNLLDRANCLPDILASANYEQVFMGGASLEFAGKGNFLSKHGYDRVLGSEQLIVELPDEEYVNGWGLYDDSLFTLALQQFDRLAEVGKPFNLSLLTIDTHHPIGDPSASCNDYPAIDNSILHSVHCTDELVGKFIEQLKASPAYEDTVVVLVSDHLAMRNNAFRLFPMNEQRELLFIALNAQGEVDPEAFATPLDIAPTVLSLLEIDHDIAFLAGVDLLSTPPEHTVRDGFSPNWLDALRYINSNHLSTGESTVLYRLNRLSLSDIDYSNDIENLEFSGDRLAFDSTSDDPHFILPRLADADFEEAKLYLTLETSRKLAVTIYYESAAGQGYSEENTLRREIEVGLNQMVFDLEGIPINSRIRIDPGHLAGEYTIHALEIRSS